MDIPPHAPLGMMVLLVQIQMMTVHMLDTVPHSVHMLDTAPHSLESLCPSQPWLKLAVVSYENEE